MFAKRCDYPWDQTVQVIIFSSLLYGPRSET